MESDYGTSTHYLGEEGQKYFSWQSVQGDTGGRIEARKFQKYIQPDDCVVDFGCGGGYILNNLHCLRRIGVEINPEARKAAVASGLECHESLLELPAEVANVVISNHALEHVPNPIQALKEIKRVLKSPGVLILVLPIDDWRSRSGFAGRMGQRYTPADVNHHLFTWTPQLIGNCLVEAGFKPADFHIDVLTHAWFPGAIRAFTALPSGLFDLGCRLYSAFARRRQVIAVVKNSPL